jgi:hypothetical protein
MSERTPGQAAYRKKPVVVEARQLTSNNATELWRWVGTSVGSNGVRDVIINIDDGLAIDTLEGTMKADFGDWIIKGVKGEFYPCKPDIFAATYEPADVAQPAPELAAARPVPELGAVAYEAAETGELRERLAEIRKLCEHRLNLVGMVDGKGVARRVLAIIDRDAITPAGTEHVGTPESAS